MAMFLAEELEDHARATAMNRILACRSFFRYLCGTGLCADDPTSNIPIRRDKVQPPRPFSDYEVRALLAATLTDRDHALLLFLIGSGCRRGELARMKARDIDFGRGRVLILGKGAKQRWVAPGRTALEALRPYAVDRDAHLWISQQGNPMTGARVYAAIERIAARAGIVNAHPHRFRVTFAVNFLREYGDIEALKQILGHEDVSTTETYALWGYADNALGMQSSFDLAGRLAQQQRVRLADAL